MRENIEERTILAAGHIVDFNHTIRQTARVFGISKSTLHHDISRRLKSIDKSLYIRVKNILGHNFSVKHIRGGEATKSVYLKKKEREF